MSLSDDEWLPPPISAADGPTDVELLVLLREDDAMALHRLMQRYWSSVLTYAVTVLGDHDAAADVAQQTFISLWQSRKRWQPTGNARAYLFRIARNAVMNDMRAHRTRNKACEAVAREQAFAMSPLELLEVDELREAVDAALRLLSPRRRQVYEMAREQGLHYREIASALGVSEQTVANHLCAAVALLRQHLEGRHPQA